MVRPAGPRISSRMLSTWSRGNAFASSRSVDSSVPCREPVADMRSVNSTNSRSTISASTLPRFAIAWLNSLISSSSRSWKMLMACSSPSESINIAAFCEPVTLRKSVLPNMA